MGDIVRGIVAAILNFMKGVLSEPKKAIDADDTTALRKRLDRLSGNAGGDGAGSQGSDESRS